MTTVAETLLKKARSMGADFRFVGDAVVVRAGQALPGDLMMELRQHKEDIRVLLTQVPDYQATACVCSVPIGSTGNTRCEYCSLPLMCPDCQRCRGCRLRLRFPTGDRFT